MRIGTSIVIEVNSVKVLYEERSQEKRFPASMTKMMTAYLTFEALKAKKFTLESLLKISQNAVSKTGSTLNLKAGDVISLEDALCCMLVKSANDAATILGESLAGSEEKAVHLMTEKSKVLGMTQTVFKNMSGLHDVQMVSTALDMANLARALILDFPEYYRFFGIKKFIYKGQTYENFNSLLGIKGVDGMKTGNTDAAGFNLAISSLQNGQRIIAVVMNAATEQERNERLLDLIEKGFQCLKGKYNIII